MKSVYGRSGFAKGTLGIREGQVLRPVPNPEVCPILDSVQHRAAGVQ
jgi:hypothetical protein